MALDLLSLSDPAVRNAASKDLPSSDYPLRLELARRDARSNTQIASIAIGSILVHLVVFLVAIELPGFVVPNRPERVVAVHHTPLYFPKELITQKAKNVNKVSKQIDLASLVAEQNERRAQEASASPTAKHFELPRDAVAPQAKTSAPKILLDAPTVAVNQAPPPENLPAIPPVPPPAPNTKPSETAPSPGVPNLNGQTGEQHAAIELKSDPQGADFKPYLTRILAIVRGNWQRITPEAVVRGHLHGRTVVEFSIGRDGRINNVVILEPSGLNQLDLISGSSLSMSNPLPALPADFKGMQIRLKFTFSYAMPSL